MLSCETFLGICFNFVQLPCGRWAGRATNGGEYEKVFVTVYKFAKGVTPERFKYEPCREADEQTSQLYYKLTY